MAFRKHHTTHVVFCRLVLFTIVSAYPPWEVFHWEQFAVFAGVCERNGSSPFFLAYNVHASRNQWFSSQYSSFSRCLLRRLPTLLAKYFLSLSLVKSASHHSPVHRIANFCQSTKEIPLNITDPLAHLKGPVIFVAGTAAAHPRLCQHLLPLLELSLKNLW